MKNSKKFLNLILDVALFFGFIIAFYLDITGLPVHQWLGIIIGAFSLIHLLLHFSWVKCVMQRFSNCAVRPKIFLLLDFAIAFGFIGIISTGILISSWLNLFFLNYSSWLTIHIAFSVETLILLVVKVGIHWRWIGTTLRALLGHKQGKLARVYPSTTAPLQVQTAEKKISRRDFLVIMGVASLTSYFALAKIFTEGEAQATNSTSAESPTTDSALNSSSSTTSSTSPTESYQSAPTSFPQVTQTQAGIQPTQSGVQPSSSSCTVLCNKHCSFPGQCRRYIDSNGNNLCDNGECL